MHATKRLNRMLWLASRTPRSSMEGQAGACGRPQHTTIRSSVLVRYRVPSSGKFSNGREMTNACHAAGWAAQNASTACSDSPHALQRVAWKVEPARAGLHGHNIPRFELAFLSILSQNRHLEHLEHIHTSSPLHRPGAANILFCYQKVCAFEK